MSVTEMELNGELLLQYSVVYRYTDAVIKKIGLSDFFTNGRYKRYKELFIGGIIAQMLSEDTGDYFYVTSPDSDPPDFTLRVMKPHEDDDQKTDEVAYAFEVVDYTEHSESVEAVIDQKLGKKYPENFSLAVLFNHPTDTTYDYDRLVAKYGDENRWILIVMRTDRTQAGILLPEERWVVAAVSKPTIQRLIKPDKVDKPGIGQMLRHKHRGKNKVSSVDRVRIKLP